MTAPVQIGLIQMMCSDNPPENFANAVERIRAAAAQGAQIICTQELFQSRYPPAMPISTSPIGWCYCPPTATQRRTNRRGSYCRHASPNAW